MLALIGLKKFRSFQEPNRIDVLEKKLLLSIPYPSAVEIVQQSLQKQKLALLVN